jgi:hypothetical protein
LQATDDFRFEAPLGNGRFLSQPTMKLFWQPKANHPMSRPPFRQGKASDGCSKGDPDNQADQGRNRDGHGDTPSTEIKRTIMLMATEPQIILRLGLSHGLVLIDLGPTAGLFIP